ncbi:RagB/SusD family nutrient uptake outer membrane protein [Chitinophaga sp. S165]|uniref:RagB/SusD family nutrient uptake outer membrane protein n=1 Tax=Chitinophaga sp. S165 TaxID=2135462 RepID=UPI000D70FB07|nr:RagB/SusD family nutrient uptake outer membrane protein [Chitinophaga sp. S165]PWV44532.1 SusD-like starch-binding protein associating with outer membrane [Chitinophaga sp. S165]
MSYFKKDVLLSIIVILLLFSSCEKFLEVGNPPDKIISKYVFESNASAIAAVTGIYPSLNDIAHGRSSVSVCCALTADELNAHPTAYSQLEFYTNSGNGQFYWSLFYTTIYRLNAALEGLSASEGVIPVIKKQLIGEVLFLRAFSYFYLVNLYGDVPLLTTADYKINSITPRSSSSEVYKAIVDDLNKAKAMLSDDYLAANILNLSEDRIRPNKMAASSLLARVYLYMEKWNEAILESSLVINDPLYAIDNLQDVFKKNSRESIWQIQPQSLDGIYFNTWDARTFVLESGPNDSQNPVWTSEFLLSAFEKNDQRLIDWMGIDSSTGVKYYYPFKYKHYKNDEPLIEYVSVLRLAEQYLIRAEAKLKTGNLVEARIDLNKIRERSNLKAIDFERPDQLADAILHERQTELFTEWGHRWLDLKRTGEVDKVMNIVVPKKGGEWRSYKKLYPIPSADIRLNPNIKQNEGYEF